MGEQTVSRRGLLGAAGIGLLFGAAGGAGAGYAASHAAAPADQAASTAAVPFHGEHQAGIATPVQDRLHFCAFDVITDSREALVALLRKWTDAAARMTAGQDAGPGGAVGGIPEAPPDDTGEALGLPPARLTITIGFGPTLFEKDGKDRFGLCSRRPAALVDLPHFPGDKLDPARCGGDLAIQACSDDPQVAVHAVRNLARIGFGVVAVRWSQLGFGKTSSTTPSEQTPRNLFGFKDGTNNIPGDDTEALRQHVWVAPEDGPDWMVGGSYLVARRIRMHIETWDRAPLAEQEQIVGRTKGEGAPLGAAREHDPVDLAKLPADSHVALSHPGANGGLRILRRGYSFVDGSDGLGRLDAGLFFIAYQRDPRKQFIPLQAKLSARDRMMEYLQHTGSGIWACPPGVRPGEFWGQRLFA
ncbi:deferrochelatase/peroxidase EfeB [Carbonactinospora thermoautotrophica]|uniref:iron uptake transporter deferrochelatase/peroxidase subunit n=1 Tax=Carbonactinospora thermoautotrophica TaxID=1469144 RepID=UPI00226F2307|nr:iron uptake transporter deferrochelatase/peroxidase subunit [Carbonactinospora thermoautotrophica]MCX9190323.1 deferrochelatase/peroxidase EfeB [Carbonactinospora thermoautotrophica]